MSTRTSICAAALHGRAFLTFNLQVNLNDLHIVLMFVPLFCLQWDGGNTDRLYNMKSHVGVKCTITNNLPPALMYNK